jgi:D-3-phosphoglycerate dehydrogenase
MVANEVKDYLENGNIKNSVNFPMAVLPRAKGQNRITIANKNVPNMIGEITSILADNNINIHDMLNKSRNDLAYNIIDVDGDVSDTIIEKLQNIEGIITVRVI